jgi:hypothetical protein
VATAVGQLVLGVEGDFMGAMRFVRRRAIQRIAIKGNPMIVKSYLVLRSHRLCRTCYSQVELTTYADADDYIDVQKRTCAQLATRSRKMRII